MKKTLALLLSLSLLLAFAAGCSSNNSAESPSAAASESASASASDETEASTPTGDLETITVGASVTPHAEILAVARDLLAEEGYSLEIVEYTDYVQPNNALESGDLDANYFQHQAYLEQFNEENGTHLASVANIHYEPFGIYAGKLSSLDEITDGSSIAIPNDGTNEGRALLLLQDLGYITLRDGVDLSATVMDIEDNLKNLDIIEMEAAQVSLSLSDVDFGIINGNYALQANLNVNEDALATESEDSVAYETYPNVLVVKEGNEDSAKTEALVKALTSEELRSYIEETYQGSVVPVF